jgi:hypothetical protein
VALPNGTPPCGACLEIDTGGRGIGDANNLPGLCSLTPSVDARGAAFSGTPKRSVANGRAKGGVVLCGAALCFAAAAAAAAAAMEANPARS